MSLLNYIAILGRQPELGLVELESLLGRGEVQPFGPQAALVDRKLDIIRLGGVVKIGEVLYRGPKTRLQELPIDLAQLPLRVTKTPFALSVSGGNETSRSVTAAGLSLKKQLRSRGPVRLVTAGKGTEVSAAQLRHNRVIEEGFELLVVVAGRDMVVAKTIGVQDIDWYSKRDYGRPVRSAKVGMLPPKLAQILVNTTSATVVADPFCGTGVVLQEALLLGREACGTDLAPDMVAASRENLPWLEGEAGGLLPKWSVAEADVRTVKLPVGCAVVSEGYLGPNLSRPPVPAELAKMRDELLKLYRAALSNFARQLLADGEVSICVPAWKVGTRWQYLGLVDELPDLGYTLKGFEAAPSSLLYSRENQVVGRQLLLLRKL
jgi:tRNA G10  N-methylase Trm11